MSIGGMVWVAAIVRHLLGQIPPPDACGFQSLFKSHAAAVATSKVAFAAMSYLRWCRVRQFQRAHATMP
jgi:hypothetical protein